MTPEDAETDGDTWTISSTAVLDVFESAERSYLEADEIAESLDCDPSLVVDELRKLESSGRVASRQSVGRVLWWDPAGTTSPRDGIAVDQNIF